MSIGYDSPLAGIAPANPHWSAIADDAVPAVEGRRAFSFSHWEGF
jgi:hypothetical protein